MLDRHSSTNLNGIMFKLLDVIPPRTALCIAHPEPLNLDLLVQSVKLAVKPES
jgi:hypothetical protein